MPKKAAKNRKKSSSNRAARARCKRCQIPVPVSWAIRGRNFPAWICKSNIFATKCTNATMHCLHHRWQVCAVLCERSRISVDSAVDNWRNRSSAPHHRRPALHRRTLAPVDQGEALPVVDQADPANRHRWLFVTSLADSAKSYRSAAAPHCRWTVALSRRCEQRHSTRSSNRSARVWTLVGGRTDQEVAFRWPHDRRGPWCLVLAVSLVCKHLLHLYRIIINKAYRHERTAYNNHYHRLFC